MSTAAAGASASLSPSTSPLHAGAGAGSMNGDDRELRQRKPRRTSSTDMNASAGMQRRRSSQGSKGKRRASSVSSSYLSAVQEELSPDDDEDELDEYDIPELHNGDPHDTFSGPLHYLPIIIVAVPSLGAILHGRAEAWTDALILILVAFYLYQVVRVPWEIYYASRTRRMNKALSIITPEGEDDETPESVKKRRHAASAELRQNELFSLALCLLSPLIGSYLLYYVRGALSEPDRYINPFNVRLFVLASGVKPWNHFFKLLKNRSLFLQSEVHYPVPTVSHLLRKVRRLEMELDELRDSFATKQDVRMLRDGVDVPLTQLSKAVRRYERKEEYLRLSAEEKFALMSQRQEDMLHEIAVSAHLIEQLRAEQQQSGSVMHALRFIFSGARRDDRRYVWYERGAFFYLFLPLIASNRILDATGRMFDTLSKKVGPMERSGMIENGSQKKGISLSP